VKLSKALKSGDGKTKEVLDALRYGSNYYNDFMTFQVFLSNPACSKRLGIAQEHC
jgi:hypothetical protein